MTVGIDKNLLNRMRNWTRDIKEGSTAFFALDQDIKEIVEYVERLEAENEKLRKGFDIYQRERDRYKHATPEMSGAYFLAGGHGPKDDNQMPQFVEIVPAYGCGWSMIYEDTGRTISYEGS